MDLPSLPIADVPNPATERADAARNRERILCQAARLVEELGAEAVSMDAIAEAAKVGKGTLFRRFGSRDALMRALLEVSEREFQEAFIRGPAPLGPGAPPGARLEAFGHALLDLLDDRSGLLLAAEAGSSPGVRLRNPVYVAYRTHVALLVRAGAPELDANYLADVLLASLSAELFVHQRRAGTSLEDLKAGWSQLVRRVLPD
jgi:AcrR family transcriptional regulator